MKKTIAIDFDGVITNPYHLKLKYIRKFGYEISINQTPYGQCVKNGIVNEKHYNIANHKALSAGPESVHLEKDFLKYYEKLLKLPNKYFIVTSRKDKDMSSLYDIINYYGVEFDGIINTNNKNKYHTLLDISADLFIEDSAYFITQVIRLLKKDSKKTLQIIYYLNQANENESVINQNVKQLKGWENIYKYIKTIRKNETK